MPKSSIFYQYFYVKFIPLYIASGKRGFERWFFKTIHKLFTDLLLTCIENNFLLPSIYRLGITILETHFQEKFTLSYNVEKLTFCRPFFTKNIASLLKLAIKFIYTFRLRGVSKKGKSGAIFGIFCPVSHLKSEGGCLLV